MQTIIGYKNKTEQYIDEDGIRMPVTSVKAHDCILLGYRIAQKDGYNALIVAYDEAKRIRKTQQGQLKSYNVKEPLRHIREIRIDSFEVSEDGKSLHLGDVDLVIGARLVPSTLFYKGQLVDVQATSKGKGFQGVVKRHGFAGGPKTHGQSDRLRAPGSIGQSATPGRVYKGKKMAGNMGVETVTIKHLRIVGLTEDEVLVKGLIPGPQQGVILIRSSKKASSQASRCSCCGDRARC
ncbi:MAG: 50S ribosomal protein L3 [Microgenomates bacterium OLB22]|nr:MAG: 50S ribosomal protein L3 [Microgenomates bacterium OLB22]